MYLAVVMILLVAALVMPESRRVLGLHLGYLIRSQAYPNFLLAHASEPPLPFFKSHVSTLSDWERYIALAEIHRNDAEKYCEEAICAAPERPEPYAAAIRYYSQKARYTRHEISELTRGNSQSYRKEESPDLKFVNKILALAGQGSKLDPDNAFFDLMAVYTLYGMRRDTEALDMMRSAARKSHYNSYSREAMVAVVKHQESLGYPRMEAHLAKNGFLFSYLWPIRQSALLTVWHAKQLEAQEKSGQAERSFSRRLSG